MGRGTDRNTGHGYQYAEERAFVYDDWNLVHEYRYDWDEDAETELEYFWGPDLSGSLQGAGGVGGLVAVSIDGDFYFPGYDNNGNVIGYWNEDGEIVAEYAYDAFGNTIYEDGDMADVFPHRFSTKYYDAEADLYYYGYRYYSPSLGRWISRDPIGEEDLLNLYVATENNCLARVDYLGLIRIINKSSRYASPAKIAYTERQLETRAAPLIAAIREPFRSAIQANWPRMVFEVLDNKPYGQENPCKETVGPTLLDFTTRRGYTIDKNQTLRAVKVTLFDGNHVPHPMSYPKNWTTRAVLCICQIKSTDEAAETAVHETAHSVGWGGYYKDDKDSRYDNLPPNMDDHPDQIYWNIPGRGYD